MHGLIVTLLGLSLEAEKGTGCQKLLTKVCPDWTTSVPKCVSCVKENIKRLEKNCTLDQAEKKRQAARTFLAP